MRFPIMAIAAACLALVGCGGAGAVATPTPNLGAEYMAIVAPGNTCLDALSTTARAVPQDNAKIRKAAAACQTADAKLNSNLLTLSKQATGATRTDIEAMRHAVAAQEALLGSIANSSDESLYASVLAYANYSDGGAASLVRSDLGLAAPPGSSPTP